MKDVPQYLLPEKVKKALQAQKLDDNSTFVPFHSAKKRRNKRSDPIKRLAKKRK
jgi:hypothetical protein